ncbi:MAG: hypothetical protein ABJ314_10745, partial [Ilumatobacter sp.]
GPAFDFEGFSERFGSVGEVSDWIERRSMEPHHDDRAAPLAHAALTALHRYVGADVSPHEFRFSTTIPRSLGLAGSSAIVIATIRTMIAAHRDDPWARELLHRPELVASLALVAERDLLGISAGLQDRVVQTLGGTVAMEFGVEHTHTEHGLDVGSYRRLGPIPDGLFIACRDGTAGDSGSVHEGVDVTAASFDRAMTAAADAARSAADAIARHDAEALGAAMDATFDQRAEVYRLDPRHVEMVHVARGNGASVNYTGSGGSVVVLAPDDRAASALADLGCTIVAL